MNHLQQLAVIYKEHLINKDVNVKKKTLLEISECLQTVKNDDSLVKVILDSDIQTFLLNLLIKSDYSLNPEILKCVELLCSYKTYFIHDCAVYTAEIILRNLFNLDKNHKFDNVVVVSLKIITKIIENLDDYYSKNNLNFPRYLDTARNLLLNKANSRVICEIIKMFSALLLHKKFQEHIDDKILIDIEQIWQLGIQKLSEIFEADPTCAVVGASKLFDSILRMLEQIIIFKKDKIGILYEKAKDASVNFLKLICIPYIAEFGLKTNDVRLEYLCFLKTLLQSNLNKNVMISISNQLVKDVNFTVITKYLDILASNSNVEEKDNIRRLCLMIICEIIVNLSDMNLCLFNEEKCKKHMFTHLQTIESVSHCLNLLKSTKISVDTKLVLIKFCTMYYVESKNIWEIYPEHLDSFVEFLKNLPFSINIDIYFLKDLWLLYTVIFCSCPERVTNNTSLYNATSTLQRLIFRNEKSFDKLLTYHISIISWIFMDPFVKKELIFAVINRWLLHSTTNQPSYVALLHAVSQYRGAACLLLNTLEYGEAPYAAAATSVLRTALTHGTLKEDPEFVQRLCTTVPYTIMNLTREEIVKERVVSCIYMLHLSSFVHTPVDRSLLEYSVKTFINSVGPLGLSNILPSVFYINAFEYANKILGVAKTNQINQVFMIFMNSQSMLYTLMMAFVSDNSKLSIKASQIFNNLLEYQTRHRIYCRNSMTIKSDVLVKLMSVEDSEQLQLNLQILQTLLCKKAKSVLGLEIDEHTLTGLYFRCFNLVNKPGKHNFTQFGLKCMESILRYSHFHNLECHSYLCHHSGNHTMILIFFDKETSRPIDRTFLSFVQCWLQFSSKNKEKMYNKLSITSTFWKISLYQIANFVLEDNIISNTENNDLVHNILRLLFQFCDLLPIELANVLRCIEENLN